MLLPGRHGSMSSGELEQVIRRNSDFLSIVRAGDGDGRAGLYNSVTGDYLGGVGGGRIPEYSRCTKLDYDCACTPGGLCRTGQHGTLLSRGWRNLLYDLLSRHYLRPTKEILRLLGDESVYKAYDYGAATAPWTATEVAPVYGTFA